MEKKIFFDFTGCEAPSKLGFDRIPCSSSNTLFQLFILLKQKRTQKFWEENSNVFGRIYLLLF